MRSDLNAYGRSWTHSPHFSLCTVCLCRKKYSHYDVEVDEEQDDKAPEFKLGSLRRPHMRAFHAAWWGFFVSFFLWFSINPLLPTIAKDLSLTKQDLWTSSILGLSGTIVVRLV